MLNIKRRVLNILSTISIFLFLSCIPIFGKNSFSFLGNLSEGLATAKIKDSEKFGYVDIKGNIIIPFQYDRADNFYNGIAEVKIDDNDYLIDKKGNKLTKDGYDSCSLPYDNGLVIVRKAEKYGLITIPDKEIVPMIYDDITELYNGIYEVIINNKHGLIDSKGKEIVPLIYDSIGEIIDGNIVVKLNKKNFVINIKNEKIYDLPDFDEMRKVTDELFQITKKEKIGYMDKKGKIIVSPQFDEVSRFVDGKAIVEKNGVYSIIDTTGKELKKINRKDVVVWGYDGKKILTKNWRSLRLGLVDLNGKTLLETKYYSINEIKNGFSIIRYNYHFGIINEEGKIVLPLDYVYLDNRNENEIIFARPNKERKGHYGIMDYNFKVIILDKYEYLSGFYNGYSTFWDEERNVVGFLDKKGKEYIVGKCEFFGEFMPEVEIEE